MQGIEITQKKVLVVDDSTTVRLYLARLMQQLGNQVLVAENGTKALQQWRENRPLDLILLDLFLPDIEGLDVLKKIRAEDKAVTIVMVTAFGGIKSAIHAVREGADGYIEKAKISTPAEHEEFIHMLSRALEIRSIVLAQHEMEEALRQQNAELRRMNDELMTARQSLLNEKNRLRDILFSLSEAVIVVDENKEVLLMNREAEAYLDWAEKQVVGKPLSELDLNPTILLMVEKTLTTGEKQRQELTQPRQKDAQQRVFSCSTVPVRNHANRISGAVIVLSDITQEKEMEQMKQDFYSMVTHDLRSPLTSLLGFADLLYTEDLGPLSEEQKEVVGIIKDSGQSLLELVNDFLDYSSIEAGFLDLHKVETDLCQIAAEVFRTMKPLADEKQHHVTLNIPDHPAFAFVDPDRIKRVLTNLYSNAIKYTPEGGQIVISVTEKTGEYIISVQDSGIGIPEESKPYLFQRYHRIKNDKTRHILGTGLGLLIAHEIIEAHGGRIWVESKAEEGSKFSFSIPKQAS